MTSEISCSLKPLMSVGYKLCYNYREYAHICIQPVCVCGLVTPLAVVHSSVCVHVHVCTGVYKLVASGPSVKAETELQLIVVPEGGEEEVTDEMDLTPIPVDGFGAYVTEQHANGNKKFASNYLVGLIHVLILPAS